METYIAFSLTDIDRNLWIYNDNSLDYMTSGKGKKKCVYTCHIDNVNNLKLKLQVSVRDNSDKMIAFADAENTPTLMISRKDIMPDDLSAKDSATGLIQRNGKWNFG